MEACCLTQKEEQTLLVFERRYNHELYQLYNEPDIVRYIKINRLRWLGHVQRMEEERVPLKMSNTNPDGNRRPGRPKARWKDAKLDLRNLRISDWR